MTRTVKIEDGIRWVNPLDATRIPFVWDDGVHAVKKVEYIGHAIAYVLGCGQMFSFGVMPGEPVLEAKIKLPATNCERCIKWLDT